jgi:peptide/nickel transport system substrate-binding protein
MAFVLPLLPEHRFAGVAFERAPANRAPLANGPYRLASWKAQESIALERNPRYWGEPGHFDRILFRILPDNSVAYRALVRGDLDESILDAGLKERASGDAEFASCCRLLEFFDLDFNYVALNTRLPFFQDARVRRALTMLLDRQAIVKNLYRGSARVISGPWPPESPAYDASVPPLAVRPRGGGTACWTRRGGAFRASDGIRRKAGRRFEFELLVSAGVPSAARST